MKVSECLNNIPETPMGYIRLVQFAMGGEGQERMMDSMTNRELVDIQQNYRLGKALVMLDGLRFSISNKWRRP